MATPFPFHHFFTNYDNYIYLSFKTTDCELSNCYHEILSSPPIKGYTGSDFRIITILHWLDFRKKESLQKCLIY